MRGFNAVVIDAKNLALGRPVFDIRKLARTICCSSRNILVGFGFESIVLFRQSCNVGLRLLQCPLKQGKTIPLPKPRRHARRHRSMSPFRDNCDLPGILNLFVVLLHRGFMRRQLCVDLGALITGFTIKILLHTSELIVVESSAFAISRSPLSTVGVEPLAWAVNCAVMSVYLGLILLDEILQLHDLLRQLKSFPGRRKLLCL